jgi:hypothetical protein
MEPVRATIRSGYRMRLGLMALALLGFSAWFFYDGLIKYPKEQQRGLAHEALVSGEVNEEVGVTQEWIDRKAAAELPGETWIALADANGWDHEPPDEPLSDWDIRTQLILGTLCALVGLPVLLAFIRTYMRWVQMDERGVSNHKGQLAAWDRITDLDDARWQTKGIAYIQHRDGDGEGTSRLMLDDWKYTAGPTRVIHDEVARRLGREPLPAVADEEPVEVGPAVAQAQAEGQGQLVEPVDDADRPATG